ncbi:MAG: hypothetical protein AAFW97_14565 [Pseudomonadota bacterium]
MTVSIYIPERHEGRVNPPSSPVFVHVEGEADGKPFRVTEEIKVGEDQTVDARVLDALTDAGIFYRKVGAVEGSPGSDTQTDDAEADAIIDGTVAEVAERIAGLTAEERARVRAAEEDREKPRKGVMEALDKAEEE